MDFWVHFKFHNLIKIRPCVPLSRPKQGYTHSTAPQTTVFSTLAFETVTIFTALTSFTITRTNYHPILLVFRPLVINTSCSSTPCCLSFLYHLHLLCPLSSLLHSVLPAGLGCSLWCQHTERGRKQEWNGEKQADELVALHGEVYLRIAVVMVKHKCVTDHQ